MPEGRPSIPAHVQRQIFVESGHRCAVCGAGFPLERAHIIPWSTTKDHSASNLICLCANCHEMADGDGWTEATLREYKQKPWVHRNNSHARPTLRQTVEITIRMEVEDFDDQKRDWLRYGLASFVGTHPKEVGIETIREGSVIATVSLPWEAGEKLLTRWRSEPEFRAYLAPLEVVDVQPIGDAEVLAEFNSQPERIRRLLIEVESKLGTIQERVRELDNAVLKLQDKAFGMGSAGAQQARPYEPAVPPSLISRTQSAFHAIRHLNWRNAWFFGGPVGIAVLMWISQVHYFLRPAPGFMVWVLAGIVCGACLKAAFEALDQRFKSIDEISSFFSIPVIATIPDVSTRKRLSENSGDQRLSTRLCSYHEPKSFAAESFRILRTSIYFATHKLPHQVIQVTSPQAGNGRTTIASNLAISLAQSGKRVLLADADFRRPTIHKLFGMEQEPGISEILEGRVVLQSAIRECPIENLSVLTCGARLSDPAKILTATEFREFIAVARENYDFVIIDTPPVLAAPDALIVGGCADFLLLVVRMNNRTRATGRAAIAALQAIGAHLLGIVVHGIDQSHIDRLSDRYPYEYRYSYGEAYYSQSRMGSEPRFGQEEVANRRRNELS